jgi:fumarate reductase flavoprotein subunit
MITKIMECDLLVLGAGGSGLVAANRAFDLTGKKVIVLEKTKKPAGCTYFASGMGEAGPIKDSKWQKDAGVAVNDDPQDLSGQFFDWLVEATTQAEAEKMFHVSKAGEQAPMGGVGRIINKERYGKYVDLPDNTIGPGRMGSWVVDHLGARCQKVGITLLTETRARKFLKDERGKVSAVVADTKDGQLVVNFSACIIAAGGYGANKELLRKYYPNQFSGGGIMHSLCPPSLTGDCILAAEEIGAYIDPTVRSMSFPGGFFGDGIVRHPWRVSLLSLASGNSCMINLDGKRWQNEADRGGSSAIGDQRDGVWIAIVDSDIVESIASQRGGGVMSMPGETAKTTMKEDLEWEAAMDDAGATGNHTKKADSLVELALKMKVDPGAFVATIERYNKFCETGKDLDFGKPVQNLKPIRKGPFYAIFGNRWSQSTKGRNGICVNSRFQVLNAKGEVMPGLWASGDGCTIFGGFFIGSQTMGNWTEEETATRTALSRDLARAMNSEASGGGGPGGGAPGGAAPSGGQAGAPAAGASGGAAPPQGGAQAGPGGTTGRSSSPMMMPGETNSADVFKGKSSPCGGLGPAFLSGYCAGTFAAAYLKKL